MRNERALLFSAPKFGASRGARVDSARKLGLFAFVLPCLWLFFNAQASAVGPFDAFWSDSNLSSEAELFDGGAGVFARAQSRDSGNVADEIPFLPNMSAEEVRDAFELADEYDVQQVGGSRIYAPATAPSVVPITISGNYGWIADEDEYGETYVLYGDCSVSQGKGSASAQIAVVWIARNVDLGGGREGTRVWAYLLQDGANSLRVDVNGVCRSAKTRDDAWLGEFTSLSDVELYIANPGEDQIRPDDVYSRARRFIEEETTPTTTGNLLDVKATDASLPSEAPRSFVVESNDAQTPGDVALGWSDSGDGEIAMIPETSQVQDYFNQIKNGVNPSRFRVQFFSRYDRDFDVSYQSNTSESRDGDGKDVCFITNGFTVILQGLAQEADFPIGDVVELSADQATVWSKTVNLNDVSSQKIVENLDLEFYLEGNVVFREGNSVVYADRMYYDVANRVGILEDAELIADVPDLEGAYFRLGASKITQRGPNAMFASDAWVTTSGMGVPTYKLQSDSIVAESKSEPLFDAVTGGRLVNSETGELLTSEKRYVISENNFVTVGNLPVAYWPWMAMDVKDRSLYLRRLKFGHDGALGTQVFTTWNPYQLFGMTKYRPDGTDWDVHLDYFSKRGFGHGTTFVYNRDSIFNWNTRAVGMLNYYGIYDNANDNLGRGRRSLPLEHKYRYRGIWKHRQELGTLDCGLGLFDNCCIRNGWTLTGQFGISSDRNYLQQYFEEEWYSSSNPETSLELKRTVNNRSLGIMASARTDKFYTQTSWLPRIDHFWLGQALAHSNLAWYEHTKVGFAQFRSAESPYAEDDKALFRYLDWELEPGSSSNTADEASTFDQDSLVFTTRHELDLPFQLGPVKTTPYALGEYGFWGHGTNDKNISRLYGRLGARFNLPIWKVNSDVESQTWYLNGLAHKMNLVADVSYSDANKDYNQLTLYDQIDDFQIEDFRRRYSVTTFAGKGAGYSDAIPLRFDERYYAIRQGEIGGSVASASSELVDDLQLVRLGWNNRIQTKRGPVGARRVVDWITFNAGLNLYPKEDQNFGKAVGLLDYDASWQVGDRFAVFSSGLYDFWGSGQKITRIGVQRRRPGLSSCYLGLDRLDGPIDSTYLNFGLTYRTSERWGIGFSNSYDLSEGCNIGQKFTVSRIGESFVLSLGASRNESKDNWGVSLSIEPVFMFDKDKKEEGLLGLGNM